MLSIEELNHVVFDFDGVIVDSEKKKFSDLQEILIDFEYDLDNLEFRNFIGKKRGQFLKEIGIHNIEEIMERVHKKDLDISSISLVKGLRNFLEFLDKNNVKMHIATGSSKIFVVTILKKYNLLKYFNEIITGDDVKESKPSPKIYLEVKGRLKNKNIIVIEDSPAGVISAKRAGLFVIGLGTDLSSDIDLLTFDEIITHLKK